jgi:hypothetical protein
MTNDPLVEEVHRIREKLLEESGGDLEKLMDRLKARETGDQSRVVSQVRGTDKSRSR